MRARHFAHQTMELGGKTQKVLLRDLQMHPFKQLVLHIDFQRVDAKTRLTMKVPLHYSGQEESPAVKAENCLVNHVLTELSISCLPKDLPEFIAVDLSGLKKGTSLHVKDITLPKGVKFVAKGGMDNPVLVSVSAVSEEAEADAAAAAAAAAPVDPKAAKAAAAKEAKAGAKADAAKPAVKK